MTDGQDPNKPRIILPPGVTLPERGESEASSDGPGDGGDADVALDAMHTRIQQLEDEVAEKQRDMLRQRAEIENVRKRIQRTAEERVKYAAEPLVRDLLLVGDDLDRALQAAEASQDVNALLQGVRMVQAQFQKSLADHGVARIPTDGERFDPAMHEAVDVQERIDVDDQTVLATHRTGYMLHDRVVRAAQVAVNRNREQQAAADRAARERAPEPIHPAPGEGVMESEEPLEAVIRALLAEHGPMDVQRLQLAVAAHPAYSVGGPPLAAVDEVGSPRLEHVLEAMPDVSFDGRVASLIGESPI